MNDYEIIKQKLGNFVRKYYINELIKGIVLFLVIGMLYFLATLSIEYFLWLNSLGRTFLFWLFVTVELGLLVKFIFVPLAKLFNISKGITNRRASEIIGNHFQDVNDKLLNLLQLSDNQATSDLLLASIAQKSKELKPVPFSLAIDFKQNLKYLKYILIPLIMFVMISLIGGVNWFSESYDRVLHYDMAYEPPAPFHFKILNDRLNAMENEDYTLKVKTEGDVIPETATITFDEETYFLKRTAPGEFQYTFVQPKESVDFLLKSNDIISKEYALEVSSVPILLDFKMNLDYPVYTGKKDEVLKSTGNAVVPEGTMVSWTVHTRNTNEVTIVIKDSILVFERQKDQFFYKNRLYNLMDYEISTSNENVKRYDNLSFTINVVKDQYPELNMSVEKDTIDERTLYFYGRVSDDYGLHKLRLVYYDIENAKEKQVKNIPIGKEVFDEFVYAFPGELLLEEGKEYEYYFEVFDNDPLHNHKSTKSSLYSFRKLTINEEQQRNLNKQNEAISGLNKSLNRFEEQQGELKELSKVQKEKKQLNYNDKKKLEDYLKRQKDQERMMKTFSEKLKQNLEEVETKKEDEPFKDALKELMERNEERLQKNEKLLEEIKKLSEQIQKEELSEKLDELAKENKNIKKNLEQLLELTKRFYVAQKHEKLADKLKDLAKRQEALSERGPEQNTKENQDKLNKEFNDFQKEMETLRKENDNLKKPMNLDQKEGDEQAIQQEQEEASKKLENEERGEAKKNQKSAAQKMKKMQEGMQMQMQMSGEAQQEEDADMLRQILDNLVDFSLVQEDLMTDFKGTNVDNPDYSIKLRKQSVLRENFVHIDDSLYALALRTPKISDEIISKLTDIEFNIDKSLERLAENQVIVGTANQQYVITGSNELAYMLSQALDQMQNSMPSQGQGKGSKGFQLPDIIKKQEELNGEMKKGMEKGEKEDEKAGEGTGNKEEEQGREQKGKDSGKGKQGKDNGKQGEDGKNNGEGESELQREEMNGELFEIYKQQQELRNALEDKLRSNGFKDENGSQLLRRMEQVEQELLENGFNERTLSKMLELKHQLLKMKDAGFEQGEEEKRESKFNREVFTNTTNSSLQKAKEYFNTTELLNRQVLPLQQNYKRKVQEYFNETKD